MPQAKGTFVKYKALPGIVGERIITEKDWQSIGISHETVKFDRSNRFMIDASGLPEEVMDYFKGDGDFIVSESDSPVALADKGVVAQNNGASTVPSGGEGSLSGTGTSGGGSTASSTSAASVGGTTTTATGTTGT